MVIAYSKGNFAVFWQSSVLTGDLLQLSTIAPTAGKGSK
jgi:hypothetical protein